MNTDAYDRVIEILTEALQTMGREGISKAEMIPPLVDFVASIALIIDGESGIRDVVAHMEQRVAEWHAGTFPQK